MVSIIINYSKHSLLIDGKKTIMIEQTVNVREKTRSKYFQVQQLIYLVLPNGK